MSSYRASDWASPQLFALAEAAEECAATLPEGSTERGCIREALRQIELADTYVERENAIRAGDRLTCRCGRVPTNALGLCATCDDERAEQVPA